MFRLFSIHSPHVGEAGQAWAIQIIWILQHSVISTAVGLQSVPIRALQQWLFISTLIIRGKSHRLQRNQLSSRDDTIYIRLDADMFICSFQHVYVHNYRDVHIINCSIYNKS